MPFIWLKSFNGSGASHDSIIPNELNGSNKLRLQMVHWIKYFISIIGTQCYLFGSYNLMVQVLQKVELIQK